MELRQPTPTQIPCQNLYPLGVVSNIPPCAIASSAGGGVDEFWTEKR